MPVPWMTSTSAGIELGLHSRSLGEQPGGPAVDQIVMHPRDLGADRMQVCAGRLRRKVGLEVFGGAPEQLVSSGDHPLRLSVRDGSSHVAPFVGVEVDRSAYAHRGAFLNLPRPPD